MSEGAHPARLSAGGGLTRQYVALVSLAALVFAVDQGTKALVRARLAGGPVRLPGGFVSLDFTRNTGAAFSLFPSGGLLLAIVGGVVCVGILLLYPRVAHGSPGVRLALGLVLGGALGNLADRVRMGYVTDFIDLHWWPVFNLADSSIFIGVLLLLLYPLLRDSVANTGD